MMREGKREGKKGKERDEMAEVRDKMGDNG